jgi:NMD protein affecting ribosome stability and mRNA decay
MSKRAAIRSRNRSQTSSGRRRAAERGGTRLREPAVCERCGALFSRRVWRRSVTLSHARLAGARWTVCPACTQVAHGVAFGRVRIRGGALQADEALIRRRIDNVAARAAATQPQRRVVSCERQGGTLEVLTTSQKLAHRIVHELRKLLGGTATYRWSEDRSLTATWESRGRRAVRQTKTEASASSVVP